MFAIIGKVILDILMQEEIEFIIKNVKSLEFVCKSEVEFQRMRIGAHFLRCCSWTAFRNNSCTLSPDKIYPVKLRCSKPHKCILGRINRTLPGIILSQRSSRANTNAFTPLATQCVSGPLNLRNSLLTFSDY